MTKVKQLPRRSTLVACLAIGAASVISVSGCRTVEMVEEAQATITETTDRFTMNVDGVGQVRVEPDSLRATVGVEARASTLQAARREAEAKTRAVLQALENLQIASLVIRTVDIDIRPILERQQPGDETPPRIIGYAATSTLSASLRGVSTDELRNQGSRILEAALSSGANVVGGVEFFLNKPREAHRLALAAAVEDAQKNARTMADQAGLRLVQLEHLSGQSEPFFQSAQKSLMAADMAGGASFPVEPGELQVTVEVSARFRFASMK